MRVTVGLFVSRFGPRSGLVIFQILTVLLLLPTTTAIVVRTTKSQDLAYLIGLKSRQRVINAEKFYYADTVDYVNHHLFPENRVLMIFEARGFYFKVPVIQDNLLTNWPLLESRSASLSRLKNSGISHLLLNTQARDYYLMRGLDPHTVKLQEFTQFANDYLDIVYENPGYILYELRK